MSIELLKKNALADAEELAVIIGREFTNADVGEFATKGVDLRLAAVCYIEDYTGKSSFFMKMKDKAAAGALTDGMVRAVMNSMREKKLGLKKSSSSSAPAERPGYTKPEDRRYSCYTCKREIVGLDEIRAHGRQHKAGVIDRDGNPVAPVEETPVIAVQESRLNLDLSMLPDGRYAVPELTGKNDLTFLMVKRVRKTHVRDRRFRYGKIVTGRERVEAGTIEVKEWSSDAKRLCGEQKHGETYHGEFEDGLELILKAPEAWAKLFGMHVGRCYICGKTLTDEESRSAGIGPECVKKNNYFTTPPPSYRTT